MSEIYEKIRKELKKAEKIVIISHRKPDADTLGAAIALKILLQRWGKNAVLACIDRPAPVFSFLPEVKTFVTEFDLKKYDLVVVVDAGASHMTGFHLKYPHIFSGEKTVVNIDHHASNDNYGTINLVDPKAASVTVMLYRMFKFWEENINHNMAVALLAGIYNDTGSFMHSNTGSEAYEIAADLMNSGAKISEMNRSLFRTRPISTLRLWGRALQNIEVTPDNIVMSVVRDQDYQLADADPEQLSGLIDYINMVPDAKFSLLLNEDRKGNVKGSFRTKNDNIDLSKIAAKFGGGGHPKASGFCVPGKISEEKHLKILSSDLSKKSLDF